MTITSEPTGERLNNPETTIPWHERALILRDNKGFLPTTVEELNEAFAAFSWQEYPGGYAKHLNEVLLHQKKHGESRPDLAVRSIIQQLILYREDAESRRLALLDLYKKLNNDVNPELPISLVIDDERLGIAGLLSVVQHGQTKRAIAEKYRRPLQGGVKKIGDRKRLVTKFDPESYDHKILSDSMLLGFHDGYGYVPPTIKTVKGLVLEAGTSHRNRRGFWDGVLVSASGHAIAKPMVDNFFDRQR